MQDSKFDRNIKLVIRFLIGTYLVLFVSLVVAAGAWVFGGGVFLAGLRRHRCGAEPGLRCLGALGLSGGWFLPDPRATEPGRVQPRPVSHFRPSTKGPRKRAFFIIWGEQIFMGPSPRNACMRV